MAWNRAFKNVDFKVPNVTLNTPDSLVTMTIDGSNAEDLMLNMVPGTNPKLQLLCVALLCLRCGWRRVMDVVSLTFLFLLPYCC